jgi:4-hydroxybenzoate polyprenyltransferase
LRPIPAGRISVRSAHGVAVVFSVVAFVGGALLDVRFFAALVVYALNNVAYTVLLKQKTVADVMSIALGFVIRVFAGGYAIDIEVTEWLVACVFALSVLLGFGKRRGEYEDLREGARAVRLVHESYTIPKLDLLLGVSAAVTIVTYMLYTMAPETAALHGTQDLLYTTPFVVYCIYRYTLKVQEPGSGDPVEVVFRDRGFTMAGLSWILLFLWLIR